MILGSFLDLSRGFVNQIKTFTTRAQGREDQEKLLNDDQLQSLRVEDVNLFVISEEAENANASTGDRHQHPLDLSPIQIQYLKDRPSAARAILHELKKKGFDCKFDLEARIVEIKILSGGSEQQALQIIKDSIVEIELPANFLSVMEMMGDAVDILPKLGPGDMEVLAVRANGEVKLVGMAITMTKLNSSLTASINRMSVKGAVGQESKEEVISLSEDHFAYLQNYKWGEMEKLVAQFSGVSLKRGKKNTLKLLGPPEAVDAAAKMIREKLDQLKTVKIDLGPKVNVATLAQVMHDVGQKHKCTVTLNQKPGSVTRAPAALERHVHSSLSLSLSGRKYTKVRVVMNALEKQQADVLVNTTNSDLDLGLGRGVSACILQAAGPTIQADVKKDFPKGITNHGDVAVSGPGNIKTCKMIFHGSLPNFPKDKSSPSYRDQEEDCFKWMVALVFNCLIKASEKGFRTVAFPALGTGLLEYPVQHVVQLMYKAVRLYNDDKRSGPIKEVIIVIYPTTKLEVKQLFLAHRQTHKLKTRHVANIGQILEDSDDKQICEIRVKVSDNLLQVVNANVYEACDVTEAVLVLWSERDILNPENNPTLKCTDPTKPSWKCSCVSSLPECLTAVDQATFPGRTLVHTYCQDNSESSVKDAIVQGLRTAAAEVKCNTITVPIAFESRLAKKPKAAAQLMINAIQAAAIDIHVVTVAIQEKAVFTPFVSEVSSMFNNKLHEPADIDKSSLAVDLWEKTFASKAAESTASLQEQSMLAPPDSILVIVTESEVKARLAAQDIKLDLTSRGYTPC